MRIIAFSDVHENETSFNKFIKALKSEDFDVLVSAGDLGHNAFTRKSISKIGGLEKPFLYVQGNWDNFSFQMRFRKISTHIHLNPVRAHIVEKPEEFFNSSYASYIGNRKDDIVHHDQILKMISKDKKSAPKLYREFVEKGIGGDLENPLSKTYGGSILGEKFFIKQALSRLKEGVVSRKETSHRKLLESTYQSDAIVNGVSAFFGIDNKAVLNDRREYRNICIYIMKKYTGMTNGQIGRIFNGLTFSAVAKVYHRMSKAVEENRTMRKKVGKIISTLS